MAKETAEERAAARERLSSEETTGAYLEFRDGTIIDAGKVVKAGPDAIVENGKLIGWRHG